MGYTAKKTVLSILWRDATYASGYNKEGLVELTTVGTFVAEDEESITVAQDIVEDGDWRNSSSIPKSCITTMTVLQRRGNGKENKRS